MYAQLRLIVAVLLVAGAAWATPPPGDCCLQRGQSAPGQDLSLKCRRLLAKGGGPYCNPPYPSETPTVTQTPPPTPTPPSGSEACLFSSASSFTDTGAPGGNDAWNLSLTDHPYPRIQLDYNLRTASSTVLCVSNLGFAVPVGATIDGIAVQRPIEALPNGLTTPFLPGAAVCDHWAVEGTIALVRLRDETGTMVGTDKADGRTLSTYSGFFGGFSDLWGTTWTPAQINSANFGFCARADGWQTSLDQHDCDIYHIVTSGDPAFFPEVLSDSTVTVCYHVP